MPAQRCHVRHQRILGHGDGALERQLRRREALQAGIEQITQRQRQLDGLRVRRLQRDAALIHVETSVHGRWVPVWPMGGFRWAFQRLSCLLWNGMGVDGTQILGECRCRRNRSSTGCQFRMGTAAAVAQRPDGDTAGLAGSGGVAGR
ncbi:hypothetical protein D3C81_1320180 [compost metagenome]